MRKISIPQISIFIILYTIILTLGIGSTWLLFGHLSLGDFRGVVLVFSGMLLSFCFALLLFRIFQFYKPLKEGEIKINSSEEFFYHIYILFFLFIFYPVMRSGVLPVPLMRLIYLGLGAKLGANTYSSGIIFDPMLVKIGSNSIVGQFALIIPHIIENDRLAHYKVTIGNNVTIGGCTTILAGVTIADNALVATGSVVLKDTHIAEGEIWGGVPAKFIKNSPPR